MATVAGTVTVPLSQGVREDLSNTITLISPDETPLFSNARKTTTNMRSSFVGPRM